MKSNVNPETGIRYGIIAANSLDPEIVERIQSTGRDVHWEQRLEELRLETKADVEDGLIDEDVFDASLDRRIEECSNRFYDDPTRDSLAEGPLDDKPEWEFIKAEHYRIY